MDEDRLDKTVRAVVFDFAAWLTTRDEKITLSCWDSSAPAAEVAEEFCTMHKIKNEEPYVDWRSRVGEPEQRLAMDHRIGKLIVFTVTRPEDHCVLGVFSTAEKAKKYADTTSCPRELWIETFHIDDE